MAASTSCATFFRSSNHSGRLHLVLAVLAMFVFYGLIIGLSVGLTVGLAGVKDCPCGYYDSSTNSYYTSSVLTDFTSIKAATAITDLNNNASASVFNQDWVVETNTIGADPPLLARDFQSENVWIQNGQLVLRQQAYTSDQSGVSGASISTKETNISHGTFRATLMITQPETNDKGSVGGFFWYADDNDEIDVEFLTKEASINDTSSYVHFTAQPSWTQAVKLPKPWESIQTYRFDYAPTKITWYNADSTRVAAITTTDVPPRGTGATIQLNLWSNNGSWSGAPSDANVSMYVQKIELYYNTTASEAGRDSDFNSQCTSAGGRARRGAICAI